MKKILTCCLIILFSVPVFAQTRGIASLTDSGSSDQPIYENSYALIIGLDRYEDPSIIPLDYAVADAEAISEVIQKFGFPEDHITVLKNEQATRENILRAFSEISAKTERDDRILLYWAGHGETEEVVDGDIGYLLPYDTEYENMFFTAISMENMRQLSRRPEAKHQMFLIDACYGGLAATTRSAGGREDFARQRLIEKTQTQAIQIITAGGKGEQVVESPNWGHSAFTKAFLEGMEELKADRNRDGLINGTELYAYLRERVPELSNQEGVTHYPRESRFDNADGEFFFVTPEFEKEQEISGNDLIETIPEWFLNPPMDDEENVHTTATGNSLRQTLTYALHGMAAKIGEKVNAIQKEFEDRSGSGEYTPSFSSSSEAVTDQQIYDLRISGIQKLSEEQGMRDGKEVYSSVFSSEITIRLDLDKKYYEFRFSDEETIGFDEEAGYSFSGSESFSDLTFGDLTEYLTQEGRFTLKLVQQDREEYDSYYALLSMPTEQLKSVIEQAQKREEELQNELREKFRQSEAYQELQQQTESDSTRNQ